MLRVVPDHRFTTRISVRWMLSVYKAAFTEFVKNMEHVKMKDRKGSRENKGSRMGKCVKLFPLISSAWHFSRLLVRTTV